MDWIGLDRIGLDCITTSSRPLSADRAEREAGMGSSDGAALGADCSLPRTTQGARFSRHDQLYTVRGNAVTTLAPVAPSGWPSAHAPPLALSLASSAPSALAHAIGTTANASFTCTLHCITLHYTALHCIALHYTALHCIALHYTALHCITLHYTALPCITLHYPALHCITLHYTALHCITLHCIALHCIALHCTALHCIASHRIAGLHCIGLQ